MEANLAALPHAAKLHKALQLAADVVNAVQAACREQRLLYIAPELTGRFHAEIDARSDYYSLGVILFQLFTGRFPFEYRDDMQIVYEHIAVIPPSIDTLDPTLPPMLGVLVAKLLQKNPGDRYQSVEGIVHDLERILADPATSFELASKDVSRLLTIPRQLYGREQEIKTIKAAIFAGRKELVVVGGSPGIGKSALISEIWEEAKQRGVFFAGSKFEQQRTTQTFNALSAVLSRYVRMVLLKDEAYIERFRTALLDALGENVALMVDFVPNLKHVVLASFELGELQPNEAQNRFNLTFLKFVQTVARFDQKLVLFIDDMQWCDAATIKLLELILHDPELDDLGVVLSYRDNEVKGSHPFALLLSQFVRSDNVIAIVLEPLGLKAIQQLAIGTFACPATEALGLAEQLLQKTGGNPFFLKELLHKLWSSQLIVFEGGAWRWSLEAIRQTRLSDNVVELVCQKIDSAPESVKDVLKCAALLGSDFDVRDIGHILGRDSEELCETLRRSQYLNFVIPIDDYSFKFAHDKVQEAFNLYLDSHEKGEFHKKAGEFFLETLGRADGRALFVITDHLNCGKLLIASAEERALLCDLNYECAQKSVKSNSYANAVFYLGEAISLQPAQRWHKDYERSVQLNTLLTEAHYLNLEFAKAKASFEETLANVRTLGDKIKITQVEIFSLIAQNKMGEALELGLAILAEFGIRMPEADDMFAYYPQLFALYDVGNVAALEALPELKDEEQLYILDILNSIMSPAYLTAPHVYPKICYVAVDLCIRYGNSAAATNVYAVHALLLSAFFNEFKQSYEFARLAQRLIERHDAKAYIAKVDMIANACVLHWNADLKTTLRPLRDTVIMGVEVGDIEYACYSGMYFLVYSLLSGKEIAPLKHEFDDQAKLMASLKQSYQHLYSSVWRQLLDNLTVERAEPWRLEGAYFSEQASLQALIDANSYSILCNVYLAKALLALVYEESAQAWDAIRRAKQYQVGVASLYQFSECHFFEALIGYRQFKLGGLARSEAEPLLQGALNHFRNLAATAPANNAHKVALLLALNAELSGEPGSWRHYQKAAELAARSGFVQLEALAHLFGFYHWQGEGMEVFAGSHLQRAKEAFARWGAGAVAGRLGRLHASCLQRAGAKGELALDKYDLASVLKASHILAQELSLDQLMHKMMNVIIENSASQIGYLYLENENGLGLVAGYHNGSFLAAVDEALLPGNIVQYVKRTRQEVIHPAPSEQDAAEQDLPELDRYVQRYRPKSLFCTPILYQGEFRGVLFLENRDIANLYSKDKVELLQFLSNQASISMEHAKLFERINTANATLEEQVRQRTQQLEEQKLRAEQALAQLQSTQGQLIQNEKMAALGQLIAGVAHEINTPIGAIKSSGSNIEQSLAHTLHGLPKLSHLLSADEQALFLHMLEQKQPLAPIRTSKEERALIRGLSVELDEEGIDDARTVAEDLVYLGAHDNWRCFLPLLTHERRDFILQTAYNVASISSNTANINQAVGRVSKIVYALKSFSHFSDSSERSMAQLKDGIETVLTIYHNQIKQNTELVRQFDEIPLMFCYPDELNQVWMNLIHNALQAMNGQGRLTIAIRRHGGEAVVAVSDTGCGIPDEIRERIFEPFFTTKPMGEGSGLGLDIVKRIVEKHGGRVLVDSTVGAGTTFSVHLPIAKEVL